MNTPSKLLVAAATLILGASCGLAADPAKAPVPPHFVGAIQPPGVPVSSPAEAASRRDEAMAREICAAADAVAEKYDNAKYLYIVSNDTKRADALRERIAVMSNITKLKKENESLEKRNGELAMEIGVKAAKLSELQAQVAKQEEALRNAAAALAAAHAPMTEPAKAEAKP